MSKSFPARPADTPAFGKTGVLVVALGTPDEPTPKAVRRYLAEFLSDPRVIEVPRAIWLPILYGPILTFRSRRSAHAYAQIWDNERGESPLRTITRDQTTALQSRLGDDLVVDWAFRYGSPSIEDKIKEMKAKGVDRLLVAPLYPHYSATTTASVQDKVFEVLGNMRWQPSLRMLPPYFANPDYISALSNSVSTVLDGMDEKPDRVIASYHSIPKTYWKKGDPYPCQCFKTTRLLGENLGLDAETLISTFQSRAGPSEWVGPYTDKTVEKLARDGVKNIAIVAPAFSADCIETLEEIDMGLRETFLEAGGEKFTYIPCLNADDLGMDMLESVIRKELSGWI